MQVKERVNNRQAGILSDTTAGQDTGHRFPTPTHAGDPPATTQIHLHFLQRIRSMFSRSGMIKIVCRDPDRQKKDSTTGRNFTAILSKNGGINFFGKSRKIIS